MVEWICLGVGMIAIATFFYLTRDKRKFFEF
jgi:hypothetical protein